MNSEEGRVSSYYVEEGIVCGSDDDTCLFLNFSPPTTETGTDTTQGVFEMG